MIRPSLKTKTTIILPIASGAVIALTLLLVHSYFQRSLKESISFQQQLTVSVLADEIDQKLQFTHGILTVLAGKVSPEMLNKPEKAVDFLREELEFSSIFDNGMFLFDGNGHMVGELPLGTSRKGADFSFRHYLKATFETKAPVISEPYISSQSHHHPSIMFTAPVFDGNARLFAVLGGSVDLTRKNFLGQIMSFKIGKTGYLYLFSQNRTLILHPDPDRIMKVDTQSGANQLFDRALNGFDGTDETVNSRGVAMLTSFQHLKSRPWILGANFPLSEAYRQIHRLNLIFSVGIIPLVLLTFFVMRHYMKKMTEPLLDFTRHVEQLPSKTGNERLYRQAELEEVATLGNAFNKLIVSLDGHREELSKREILYRTIVEFSSDLIFWISPDGKTLYYISPACEQISGYHDHEFYQDPDLLNRIIHSDYRQVWHEHVCRVNTGGCTEPLELAIVTKQGMNCWVSHSCKPVFNDLGDFCGVRGNFSDRTQLMESENARQASDEALHRQNEYLVALHKTTLGLITRLEINSLLLDIVTRAATLMNTGHGYIYLLNSEGTEMVTQVQLGVFDTFEHHSLKRGEGMAGYVWAHGEPYCVEDYRAWPGRLADRRRDVLRSMAGVPLTSGSEVVGVIGLAYIDETSRFDNERMELLSRFAELASLALDNARLYDSAKKELVKRTRMEERLRKLSYAVEQSPLSIVITDQHGNIEYANPHFTQLTGYDLNELLGENPRILKSGSTSAVEYHAMWETILAGGEWRGEFYNRKKNGEYYWELALISPIRDQTGAITNFIAIKEDITERKKLESQLRHSQKMEAVGQLAGGIAHDFNNILTAIIGYATIMQMQISAESRLKSTVDHILATAERGASLTQGLLAFSRKQVSDPDRVNLNEIVERVNKLLLRLIGEDLHLKIMLTSRELPVMADSIQIEQVLMNLATNARDAMPDGGTIVIKTEVKTLDTLFVTSHGFGEQGHYALLTVSDTGCGMDDETVKHIFEPFYTTKETGKGTGLGLSIVYGIVKKHGGFITCHSAPGKGTALQIYLPLTDNPEQIPLSETGALPFRRGSELVLLAEDDEPTRSLTRELLEEFGYSVIEAEDGCQAVEIYREQREWIQLVILDAIMPGMKGMDVYREIRALTPDARVLFYSGYNPEDIEGLGASDRNLHFISKPFMPKELLMKIREVLEDVA
jgi:two-component system cell cycle sensor histidine kinase/response regulator CckA